MASDASQATSGSAAALSARGDSPRITKKAKIEGCYRKTACCSFDEQVKNKTTKRPTPRFRRTSRLQRVASTTRTLHDEHPEAPSRCVTTRPPGESVAIRRSRGGRVQASDKIYMHVGHDERSGSEPDIRPTCPGASTRAIRLLVSGKTKI